MRQFDAANISSRQIDIYKDRTLEDPEEDSDEETEGRLIEGSEAESQEDQVEDSREEPDLGYQNSSDEIEKCIFEKTVKQINIEYADTDQHNKPGMLGVVVDEYSEKQETAYNTVKRRRSRWDQNPEEDRETGKADIKGKKLKTRWDADNSQLSFQEPLQLTNLGKGSGSLPEPRLSEINSILPPLEDNKLGIRICIAQVNLCDKLIKESQRIIQELVNKNATFETLPKIKSRKLYIPVKEYPGYNFIGLLLGPKGNTQKKMEMVTGAKIRLRGKGATKTSQEADPSDDEDLHVFIEAGCQDSLDAAVCMVEKLLIPLEEGKNDHKRVQLLEFGLLQQANLVNSCSICKESGHNHYACPQRSSTLKAACDTCGSFSHPTSGCHITSFNSKIKSSKEISASNLYVGHLPPTIDDNRLRELFSPFGTIVQSRVVTDHITGHSKGYGFVRFDTPSAASLAIMHMNGYQTDGHRLAVRIAGVPPAAVSPATGFLPVYPGPAAIVSSSSVLPHHMLPEAQVSFPTVRGLGFPPTSVNMEYSSQTGAAVIPPVVPGSTESRTAFASTGTVSIFSGGGGLGFPPTTQNMEYNRQYPQTGAAVIPPVVSGSAESRTASASIGSVSMLPGGGGLGFPSTSLNMEYSCQYPQNGAAVIPPVVSGSTESQTASASTGSVSMFPGGGGLGFPHTSLNMEYSHPYPQTGAVVIPPAVSGSTESRIASASIGSVSMFPVGGGLGFPPTSLNMEYQYPQTGAAVISPVVLASTASRTAFASTGSVSMFAGDPDYPGSGLKSYFTT